MMNKASCYLLLLMISLALIIPFKWQTSKDQEQLNRILNQYSSYQVIHFLNKKHSAIHHHLKAQLAPIGLSTSCDTCSLKIGIADSLASFDIMDAVDSFYYEGKRVYLLQTLVANAQ